MGGAHIRTCARALTVCAGFYAPGAVAADTGDIHAVVEAYTTAYEARDVDAMLAFFPPAYFVTVARGDDANLPEAHTSIAGFFQRLFDGMPPIDDPRLDAHWTRWQDRTIEISQTHALKAGGQLLKLSFQGEYELLGYRHSASRTLIAVLHNDTLFLMDPAYSQLRRVMKIAYPQVVDADGKGKARMKKLEN